MAIIDNRVTAEGDILIIKPEVPIIGLLSLSQFVDTTQGESETDYFKKEFRYSTNGGVTFSEWASLTNLNISEAVITKYDQFVIEYKYTRIGSAPEVELEFDDILVSGQIEDLPYPIYRSTFFKDFFEVNDINVYGWALNVLEKLYQKGILPEYIIRNEGNNNLEDEDFIVFWNTVTHFFAIIVYYARQYRDITQNNTLIENFIKNRGLEGSSLTTDDLIYIFNNWVNEYKKRGTYQILDKKADGKDVDGELLRLIGYSDPEEFVLAHLKPSETGWCIGKSSPMWNGTEKKINIIKGFEFTKEVENLTKYPLINESEISLIDGKIHINTLSPSHMSGIGDIDGSKKITVSPYLDYEISFFVKTSNPITPITFSLKGYDSQENNVNFESITTGNTSNDFFVRQNIKVADTLYFIRGILYSQNTEIDANKTMYPNGNCLRSTSNLKYIVPQILLDNSLAGVNSGTLDIWNLKVRPLKTNFTQGQLGIKNLILLYLSNNNVEYDADKLEDIIKSNLINAGSYLKNNYLGVDVYFTPSTLDKANLLYIYNNKKGVYLDFYNSENTILIQRIDIYKGNTVKVDISTYESVVSGEYTLRMYDENDVLYKIFEDKLTIN